MLCEKCQQLEATVHLKGTRSVRGGSAREPFEQHLCESCASSSPVVNPALRYGPSVITEKLRVLSVTPERTRLRLVRTDADAAPEEWSFLTSSLPVHFAVVGMEFEMSCSPEELAQLKGRDNNAA